MAQILLPPNWFETHSQRQRDEYTAMQPELARFRETEEERRTKANENAIDFIEIENDEWVVPDQSNFKLWAEWLARVGRESVRFDRWRYPHIS